MKKVKVVFILIIFVVTILLIHELSENKFDPPNDVFANSLTCSPIPAGIVYWLRGENNANDFFTNHDGIAYGGLTYTEGMVGDAFFFDGEDDYVIIQSSEEIPHGSDPRTIEMWIYSLNNSWITDRHTPFHTGSAQIRRSFSIDFQTYPTLQFYTWADDLYIDTTLPEVGWFHVAMVYNGDRLLSAYINGQISDTHTLGGLLDTPNLETFIGSDFYDVSSNYYIGNIDEISMYNRALSETEILNIYNAGSHGKCLYSNFFPLVQNP